MSASDASKSVKVKTASFLTAMMLFIVLDLLWVGGIAQGFYQGQIGQLLRDFVRWDAVGIFYFLYVAGIMTFCVNPVSTDRRWFEACGRGAALGAVAYGTYNLTNLATLEGWTYLMAAVDICWGVIATAIVASISFSSKRYMTYAS